MAAPTPPEPTSDNALQRLAERLRSGAAARWQKARPVELWKTVLIGPDWSRLLSSLTVTGLTRDTIGLLSCGRLCSPGSVYLASRHFCTLEMGWSVREQLGKPVGL